MFFPVTRTCSSWIWDWTFSFVCLTRATISLPFSLEIPCWMAITWRTSPPEAGSTFPYWRALRETPRFTNFDWRTSTTAFSRKSSSVSTLMPSLSSVISVFDPLKSYRWPISLTAWLTALSTSCMFTTDTTSNDGILFPPLFFRSAFPFVPMKT